MSPASVCRCEVLCVQVVFEYDERRRVVASVFVRKACSPKSVADKDDDDIAVPTPS